jgi:hypothetical protein
MCTVSVVPGPDGFRMVSNRDERDTRPEALVPAPHRAAQRSAWYPVDPVGGGTWIGANDAHLAMAILNQSSLSRRPPDAVHPPLSRGLIIPRLLAHDLLANALEEARTMRLDGFEPFLLVAVQRRTLATLRWTGAARALEAFPLTHPVVFTSSSLGDALVRGPRQLLFMRLVLGATDSWLDGQRRFHEHRWRTHPELSVEMSRPGARTVSRTVIDISPDGVRLAYQPLGSIPPSNAVH